MRAFHDAVTEWAAGGPGEPARELAGRLRVRSAVLLEGLSDVAAVDALAGRRGRDLAAEGVCVVSMGGAMNVGRYARLLGAAGLGLRLTGLCDERERRFYDRALGQGEDSVFVCVADLEDEFIRALGVVRVEELIREAGEWHPWQTFARQPAQQDRTTHRLLWRFLGTKAGRKIRYGRLLTEAACDAGCVPAPLEELFARL
ncbi:TOPRIM nucleotidyl transferase/hydrolase domain-containing protein [Streptomyces endophyticus]|uniref:ATP-dependent endonuclease n=1 Tax=Streptomyces endophyticus TaxID=714166 RepID=A0ABU6F0E2_9ACTN|nr:TOPRIM nucleotidyl transferase/hydrolase domain-containing protein [Streptomyces endophyticus]MEB8337464.1 ATP-dependent endonuclease [Streptomyces endophyticus]